MTSLVPESRGQWMPQLCGQRQELSGWREPRAWRRKLFGAGGGSPWRKPSKPIISSASVLPSVNWEKKWPAVFLPFLGALLSRSGGWVGVRGVAGGSCDCPYGGKAGV